MPTTTTPITTDGWYAHTDGTYGFYVGAAQPGGPAMTSGPLADYECVKYAPDGYILEIGWPARAALANAAGVDQDNLTPQIALRALGKLRARTPIQSAVGSAGHYANVDTLKQLGYSPRSIEAAVRRGELRWTSDAHLEVVEE